MNLKRTEQFIFYVFKNLPSDIKKFDKGYYPQVRGEFTSTDIQNGADNKLKKIKELKFEKETSKY